MPTSGTLLPRYARPRLDVQGGPDCCISVSFDTNVYLPRHRPVLHPQASGPPSQGSGPQEFPSSSCLFRTTTGALMMRLSMNGQLVHCGWAAAGDFPDSPQGDWAVAGAYRELILRVRNILREDPKAAIPEARVDDAGNRVAPWQPGDGTLRPEVVQRLRAAVTLRGAAPGGTHGSMWDMVRSRSEPT